MRHAVLVLFLVAGCGSSVVVGGGDEEGGSSSSGSSSGSAGGEPCQVCLNTGLSSFEPGLLCPGEERANYDALIACACSETTCMHPAPCSSPKWHDLLCDGGSVDGPCATCLEEHCLAERLACRGEEP